MPLPQENSPSQVPAPTAGDLTDDEIVARALAILERRAKKGECVTSPAAVREYLRLAIGERERGILWW